MILTRKFLIYWAAGHRKDSPVAPYYYLQFVVMGRKKIGPIERLGCIVSVFQKPGTFWA
jgi:hypothetical protein